jgi:serine/threonine protein kinase
MLLDEFREMSGISVRSEDPSELFELIEVLGKGSYGQVFKARNLATSAISAVKVVSIDDEDDLKSIKAEIGIMEDCVHGNIVRYEGCYFKSDHLWISMELCGGGSVTDLMNVLERVMAVDHIAVIAREALKGLAYLHATRKIHRDIKGGNILVTESGQVKLGDFGVSAQLGAGVSKRNTFIGKPYWMAPEVVQEDKYDGQADVWSLGITCIEMAEGAPPLSNVHPMRVLFMIPRDPPPKLKEPHKYSSDFVNFVSQCLTKDPNQRPTAEALLTHPFILSAKPTSVLSDLIDQVNIVVETRGYRFREDVEEGEDDAAGSSSAGGTFVMNGGSSDAGTFVQNKSEAGTFVQNKSEAGTFVHNKNDAGTFVQNKSDAGTFVQNKSDAGTFVQNKSSAGTFVQNSSTSGTFVQHSTPGTFQAKPPGRGSVSERRPSLAMSRASAAAFDELHALYRKDCSIRIPILPISTVDPSALLLGHATHSPEAEIAAVEHYLRELTGGADPGPEIDDALAMPKIRALVHLYGAAKAKRDCPQGHPSQKEYDAANAAVNHLEVAIKTTLRL